MFSSNSFSQASFSTNAFKQSQVAPGDCKFWADGFWSTGFWENGFWCDGNKKVDARSGYWRLFYTNLQAASEKKRRSNIEVPQPKKASKVKVRYLKDRPPEFTKVVTPELLPYRVLRPLLPSTAPYYGLTIFDIVKQQGLTPAPYCATMSILPVQEPLNELVIDSAANDEALLLILLAA